MSQKDVGDSFNSRLKDLEGRKNALQAENSKLRSQVGCVAGPVVRFLDSIQSSPILNKASAVHNRGEMVQGGKTISEYLFDVILTILI